MVIIVDIKAFVGGLSNKYGDLLFLSEKTVLISDIIVNCDKNSRSLLILELVRVAHGVETDFSLAFNLALYLR